MRPYICLIFNLFSFYSAMAQDISGIYKVEKSMIIVSYHHNSKICHFQLENSDSSFITVDDRILLIPVDSILISLSKKWTKLDKTKGDSYQMKARDYQKKNCLITFDKLPNKRRTLKIKFKSFLLQYDLIEL
jgi:hypothetical protein